MRCSTFHQHRNTTGLSFLRCAASPRNDGGRSATSPVEASAQARTNRPWPSRSPPAPISTPFAAISDLRAGVPVRRCNIEVSRAPQSAPHRKSPLPSGTDTRHNAYASPGVSLFVYEFLISVPSHEPQNARSGAALQCTLCRWRFDAHSLKTNARHRSVHGRGAG